MRDLGIHWTGPSFQISGVAYGGVPILVWTATMEILFIPTQYLVYIAVVRGRSRSPKTWKTYGYVLRGFLAFMSQHSFDWKSATEEHLAHYRNELEKRDLGRHRIGRSVHIICDFYEWAFSRGFVDTRPVTYEEVRRTAHGMLAHLGPTEGHRPTISPRIPKRRRYARFYDKTEQQLIYEKLDARDQLIMDWALFTGAREFEICELLIDQLPSPSAYRGRRMYSIPIRGKGGVLADLWVPCWLLDKTFRYCRFFGRADIVSRALARNKATPQNIFLSRWGDALKPNSVYKAFTSKVKSVGLRGTFHHLRHTYAMSMLHLLMKHPKHANTDGLNALNDLKLFMRHESLSSLMHYLEARKFYIDSIYADLFELPEQLVAR